MTNTCKTSPFSIKKATSFPYLAGYTWIHFCNWRMLNIERDHGPVRFSAESVGKGDAIYLDYGCIEDFAQRILPKIKEPIVLISSNYGFLSDYSLPGPFSHLLNQETIAAWFVQNIDQNPSQKLIPIPIGIANRYWEHGNTDLLNQWIPISLKKKSKSIFCYLNYTPRKTRIHCTEHFRKINIPFIKRNNFREYLNDLSESIFVVSPPGNGIDCHRTWEALLMGCFPIVESSTLDPLYEDLPVVKVKNWSEATEEFLKNKYQELRCRTWPREKLYAPFWFEKVKAIQTRIRSS